MLEQLNYYFEETVDVSKLPKEQRLKISGQKIVRKLTPLHLALSTGNNRSINTLLKYLGMVDVIHSDTIKDILPQLIQYRNFIEFMDNMLIKTSFMMNKQTLKVKQCYSEEIVSVRRSNALNIDDLYFQKMMVEDKTNENYKSYPVEVRAIRVDWIL